MYKEWHEFEMRERVAGVRVVRHMRSVQLEFLRWALLDREGCVLPTLSLIKPHP